MKTKIEMQVAPEGAGFSPEWVRAFVREIMKGAAKTLQETDGGSRVGNISGTQETAHGQ